LEEIVDVAFQAAPQDATVSQRIHPLALVGPARPDEHGHDRQTPGRCAAIVLEAQALLRFNGKHHADLRSWIVSAWPSTLTFAVAAPAPSGAAAHCTVSVSPAM